MADFAKMRYSKKNYDETVEEETIELGREVKVNVVEPPHEWFVCAICPSESFTLEHLDLIDSLDLQLTIQVGSSMQRKMLTDHSHFIDNLMTIPISKEMLASFNPSLQTHCLPVFAISSKCSV